MPQFEIQKDTLMKLINLLEILGGAVDAQDTISKNVSDAITDFAGKSYSTKKPIQEIVEDKLGIQLRSDTLNFDVNWYSSLSPADLLPFSVRMQNAAYTLSRYLEVNAEEFDTKQTVWVPASEFP